MKREHLISASVGLYAVIAVMTFGHAAASYDALAAAEYAACDSATTICIRDRMAPMSGLTAAALWPLYWSWEAWS